MLSKMLDAVKSVAANKAVREATQDSLKNALKGKSWDVPIPEALINRGLANPEQFDPRIKVLQVEIHDDYFKVSGQSRAVGVGAAFTGGFEIAEFEHSAARKEAVIKARADQPLTISGEGVAARILLACITMILEGLFGKSVTEVLLARDGIVSAGGGVYRIDLSVLNLEEKLSGMVADEIGKLPFLSRITAGAPDRVAQVLSTPIAEISIRGVRCTFGKMIAKVTIG